MLYRQSRVPDSLNLGDLFYILHVFYIFVPIQLTFTGA